MPKYIIIGLSVIIITFIIMNYWSKLHSTKKNKIIALIFAIIALGFVVLLTLLIS